MKPGHEEMAAAARAVLDCPFARMVLALLSEIEDLRLRVPA